jgi:hypothetical protein
MTEPFTFYVVQFAHTDIGYTHPQEQIKLMYLEFYDKVLSLCECSKNDPETHRFKWVCETAWQVRHYLEQCPEREVEFVECVRRGQIEITASYLHFSDLLDADSLERSFEWVLEFCARHDLPLKTAMHCDINGWSWALADVLAKYGITNFASAVHVDSATDPLGKQGSIHYHWLREWNAGIRRDVPIRVPKAFVWQGPAGGQVLHWLGEHYHLGNTMGFSSNYGFHAEKSRRYYETDPLTAEEIYATAKHEIPAYLERVRKEGYALSSMLMGTGGFFVDNACPDHRWCEVIRLWNAEHDDIKLRTATFTEWFEELRRLEPNPPVRAVAWPDGWAHGLGSMTARVAQARRTQRRRASVAALVESSSNAVAKRHLATALEQERLALEHTFDAWCTTGIPAASMNAFQQSVKEVTFHNAEMFLDEASDTALRALIPQPDRSRLQVHLNGDTLQTVHFSAPDLQPNPLESVLVGTDGQQHAFQLDYDQPHSFIALLPSNSEALTTFDLESEDLSALEARAQSSQLNPLARRSSESQDATATSLETAGWSLNLDPKTGALTSLRDAKREWVDSSNKFGFGQLVRETVVHPLGREASGNLGRFVAMGVAGPEMQAHLGNAKVYDHQTLEMHGAPRLMTGAVFDALQSESASSAFGKLRVTWRAYHAAPLVELILEWDKPWSDLPEAAYVAFPFAAKALQLETSGGFFTPGSHEDGGQLPGTVSSFYTTQRAAKISAVNSSLMWLPLDAPLVMTQDINFSRWDITPYTWNGFIASMPVNHYWHTNFPTSQRGPLRLRYRFYSSDLADETAIRAALPVDALGWR